MRVAPVRLGTIRLELAAHESRVDIHAVSVLNDAGEQRRRGRRLHGIREHDREERTTVVDEVGFRSRNVVERERLRGRARHPQLVDQLDLSRNVRGCPVELDRDLVDEDGFLRRELLNSVVAVLGRQRADGVDVLLLADVGAVLDATVTVPEDVPACGSPHLNRVGVEVAGAEPGVAVGTIAATHAEPLFLWVAHLESQEQILPGLNALERNVQVHPDQVVLVRIRGNPRVEVERLPVADVDVVGARPDLEVVVGVQVATDAQVVVRCQEGVLVELLPVELPAGDPDHELPHGIDADRDGRVVAVRDIPRFSHERGLVGEAFAPAGAAAALAGGGGGGGGGSPTGAATARVSRGWFTAAYCEGAHEESCESEILGIVQDKTPSLCGQCPHMGKYVSQTQNVSVTWQQPATEKNLCGDCFPKNSFLYLLTQLKSRLPRQWEYLSGSEVTLNLRIISLPDSFIINLTNLM